MAKECPKTCNKCKDSSTEPATTSSPNSRKPATSTQHPSPQSNSNCVDQVNPKTGSSDCPQRAHLCNNPKYQALMAKECPKTCNKCKDSSTEPATTSSPNSRKPATSTQHPSPQSNSNCVDQVNPKTGSSDCPQRAHLCNNPKYQALMAKECPKTCNKCKDSSTEPATTSSPNSRKPATSTQHPSPQSNSNCVDQVNPKTGSSDCPQRAHLCNNPKYQALMAKECPKTCNKCKDSSTEPATTSSPNSRKPATSTQHPSPQSNSNCVDQVNPKTGSSDCPQRAHLCNNPKYQTLMAKECPKTCNKCKDSSTEPATTSSPNSREPATSTQHPSPQSNSNCVDQVNPKTGSSDCPQRAHLCNNPKYQALMAKECPKTCNKCKDSSTEPATTSSPNSRKPAAAKPKQTNTNSARTSHCVDQVNPKTGFSDCPQRAYLCNNSKYQALMAKQCPKTCNKCRNSSANDTDKQPQTYNSDSHRAPKNCSDLINPHTGVSDCSMRKKLCNQPHYRSLMRQQCPKTCGFCS